jgi:peptidoglycan/LPS O-acetylase OafA/YrhL
MKESPTLEDYLATGALANVPLWIYLLLLTLDVGLYTQSNPSLFYTIIPVIAMLTGGFTASYLMCRRIKSHSFRNSLLFGASATIINLIFGVATLAPTTPFIAALCFVAGAVIAVVLWRRKDKELGT